MFIGDRRSARLRSGGAMALDAARGRGRRRTHSTCAVGQPPADEPAHRGRQPTGARCNASKIIESIDLRQETLSPLGEHCAIVCAARRERKVK
ncbi:MAG: hypothetical protein IPN24_03430 [Betaproteobacteria bacterium]|nr:hypothetical protein [Betaproteobacteria bacterium]